MAKIRRIKIPRDDLFDVETPPAIVEHSIAISEEEVDDEVDAIDKMLDGDDEDFDRLDY